MNTAQEILDENYNIVVQVRKPQSKLAQRLGLAFHPRYQYWIYDSEELCGGGEHLHSVEETLTEAKKHIKEITQRKLSFSNIEAIKKKHPRCDPTLSITAREVL